jgi:hypothetical protein
VTRDEWLAAFASRIGQEPPSDEEIETMLDVAAVAAHASERTAAPLACWMSGKTGRPLAELLEIAKQVESG